MKKKILITGFSGFVARHFLNYMVEKHEEVEVFGIDIIPPPYALATYEDKITVHFQKINLLDVDTLKDYLSAVQPDYILHLASFSSVAYSWNNPGISFVNNTNIFLNLVLSVKELGIKARILSVGSSEEYGGCLEKDMPLREEYPLKPCSPYAVARVSQEMLSKVFTESYGMEIIMTRSFNHIGPWQDSRFVIPGFIEKVLEIKKQGKRCGIIEVGDLNIIRDFVDVRDVVKAYWLLLCEGRKGEVYNICSGKGIRLEDMLKMIGELADVSVEGKRTEKFIRPNENRMIIGSNEKMYKELGWFPNIELKVTLENMILESGINSVC